MRVSRRVGRAAAAFALHAFLLAAAHRLPAKGMEGFRLLPPPDQDLSLEWRVLEREHFRITFPSHLAETAESIGSEAERALALLQEWRGGGTVDLPIGARGTRARNKKIDIVVSDKSDSANGFVSMGPRGYFITLHAVHPYDSASWGLDSYTDWYGDLLVHEIAHYLHLDAVSGAPGYTRRIFGCAVHPNAATPLFLREGYATYAETYAGRAGGCASGRGVSPVTDMFLRTSVSAGEFLGLDRASSDVSVWPGAQGHYLFGVSFLQHLAGTAGEASLHEFNRRTSRTCPYLWNSRFREVYGVPARAAWKAWSDAEEEDQTARIAAIQAGGSIELAPLNGRTGTVFGLDVDRSGTLIAYSIRPPDREGGLYLYDRAEGKERRLARGIYPKCISFDESGKVLYYLRGETRKNVYYRKNLVAFDDEKRVERRITREGAIQGFAALRDKGSFLLCVSTPRGTKIALLEQGRPPRDLLDESSLRGEDGVVFAVVSEPALSPQGREIAFSCRDALGDQRLCTAELSALREGEVALRRITPPGIRAYSPQWLDDRRVLYVSDEGGVYNLHVVDVRTLERVKVSNVVGGLFDARASGGTAVVKEYTSRGFRVSLLTLGGEEPCFETGPNDSLRPHPASPAERRDAAGGGRRTPPRPEGGSGSGTDSRPETLRYEPLRRVLPGYWLPVRMGDGILFGVGISTSGGDILRKHAYDAGILFDVPVGTLRARFSYRFNALPRIGPFLSLSAVERPPFDDLAPELASYQGLQASIRGSAASVRSELGAILEDRYGGPNVLFEYDSLKTVRRFLGPERGTRARQEGFLNLRGGDFAVLTGSISSYLPLSGFMVLSGHARVRGGAGALRNPVVSGSSGSYEFLPLNGILTPGYPDPVRGEAAASVRGTLGLPLFAPERGLNAFPLLFEGLAIGAALDAGVLFSDEEGPHAARPEDERSVAPSLGAVFRDPARHIRTSCSLELKAGFLAGYDFPVDAAVGYTFAFSEGGRSGPFGSLSIGFGF